MPIIHIRWPKYWSFSFSISPSNEYSGPISFRMDWLDLPAVQGTLKSLLQHHSSKASVLRCSAFLVWTNSKDHEASELAHLLWAAWGSLCVPAKWHLGTSRWYRASIANRLGQPRSSEPWAPVRMLGRRCQGSASDAPIWVDTRRWDVCHQTWEAEPEGPRTASQARSHSS